MNDPATFLTIQRRLDEKKRNVKIVREYATARRDGFDVPLIGIPKSAMPTDDIDKMSPVKKRIRQDKPLNKGEQEFGEILKRRFPGADIRAQSLRLAIGSGAWWKPDWLVFDEAMNSITFYEVKGPKAARWSRRGELTIKVAARAWPMFRFVLAWKENGSWQEQEILP